MATLTIPATAYKQPDSLSVSLNNEYWNAYKAGQSRAQLIAPNPADFGKYAIASLDSQFAHAMWWLAFRNLCLAPAVQGFVNDTATGMNDALENGMEWLWDNDPMSPRNHTY